MPRDTDNRIYGTSTATLSRTSDKVNAQGTAYVDFGCLTDYGVSNSTEIYNAELELTFDIDMKWDGTGGVSKFWMKIFGDDGYVKFSCKLEKNDGSGWTDIYTFKTTEFDLPTNYHSEDTNNRLEVEDKVEYKLNKRYVASFKISPKNLNDSIKGTKANEKIRLNMYIENKDGDKAVYYFTSAKLTVEYGIDGM